MKTREKIRAICELNQLSQEEIAEKLNMTTSSYSKIEQGKSVMNISRLEQITNIFQIDVCDLLRNDKALIIQLDEINSGNNNHIAIAFCNMR